MHRGGKFLNGTERPGSRPPPPPPSPVTANFTSSGPENIHQGQGPSRPPNATFDDMMACSDTRLRTRSHRARHALDTDHRLLIDTLSSLANHSNIRATAMIKDSVSDAELSTLNDLGVCAALRHRALLRRVQSPPSVHALDPTREIGWHARLHVHGPHLLEYTDMLASVKDLTIVVDHIGGFELLRALASPVSMASRSDQPRMVVDTLQRKSPVEHLQGWDDAGYLRGGVCAGWPDRVIWGPDWPHVR